MDRRQFLVAVPCGALLPSLASAQEPGRVYRMAVISPSEGAVEFIRNLMLPELARLGFVVGRNLTMTTHFGPPARMPELAREAIATKPDVVVAVSTVAILAVKEASSTVPIVMHFIGEDPIAKGLAVSLARPGGSATGVAMMAAQLDGKRASLLHEFVPAARRIAILSGRPPRHAEGVEEAQRVARELGLETDVMSQRSPVCARPAPRHWSSSLRRISFVTPRCCRECVRGWPADRVRMGEHGTRWLSHRLRPELCCDLASCRRLRRPNSAWCDAGGAADRATNGIRVCY